MASQRRLPVGVEILEDRLCLSAVVRLDRSERVLRIRGTEHADIVRVTQDELNNQLHVYTAVRDGDQETGAQLQTFNTHLIRKLDVRLGNGDDSFEYTAATKSVKSLELQLGNGNDTAMLDFAESTFSDDRIQPIGPVTPGLPGGLPTILPVVNNTDCGCGGGGAAARPTLANLLVQAGLGNDQVFARFGSLQARQTINYEADLSNGADLGDVALAGTLADRSLLNVIQRGGTDNDQLAFHAQNANLALNSNLRVTQRGQSGVDQMTTRHEGTVDGRLLFDTDSGTGNDVVDQEIIAAYMSRGRAESLVRGDAGADQLRHYVLREIPEVVPMVYFIPAQMRARTEGGSGVDSSWANSLVTVRGVENLHAI